MDEITWMTWLGFYAGLVGHATVLIGAMVYWTNRIVAVEEKVSAVTKAVDEALPELRGDVKKLLGRLC